MPGKFKRRLTFANVTSLLALFFALGGSAYAAAIVTSNDDVAPDTIAGHRPGPGKHANLILGSVTNDDLEPQTVRTNRIKNGTLVGDDLRADSVDGTKVKDGALGLADLAANSVDETKVRDGSIHGADIADDSVGAADLEGATFYGVASTEADDPVGGPPTEVLLVRFNTLDLIGRCNESSAGVVTSQVVARATHASFNVDSTAPGGVNDGPAVANGGEATLASLGPTTGAHVAAGSFGIVQASAQTGRLLHSIAGTVAISTHAQGVDCSWDVTGEG